ncbi:MAG: 3-hydroxyacyl-CoA dehydrogenase [Gemmobacter sp.]
MTMPGRVTIAGCGLIGRGWAAAFARAGWPVTLWDRESKVLDPAANAVAASLADMAAAGLSLAQGGAGPVTVCDDLGKALIGADYVQENIPEDRAAKAALFRALDAMAPPSALIGSSTSTIAGSLFLADLPGRRRCMVAHPANPPHLMPVVELVPSPWHDAADVAAFRAALEAVGQVPVVLQREIEGFVMNRLQAAVVNEAVALVAAGVIDPEGLDAVMKHSLGLRWALMGPFETMDLNAPAGFLDYATRYGENYRAIGTQLTVGDAWPAAALDRIEAARRAAVPADAVSRRMRWRDRALMRLLALRAGMDDQPAGDAP